MFTGSAVGLVEIFDGAFCLQDERANVCLWLVSPELTVVERLRGVVGERVLLTFEVTPQIASRYVVPLQIQRCPEEYRRPTFLAQFTAAGLYLCGDFAQPHLRGTFSHGPDRYARVVPLFLSPEDFAYLWGQKIARAASDKRLLDAVAASPEGKSVDARALFQRIITGDVVIHQEHFELLALHSLQTLHEWAAAMVEEESTALLPGLDEGSDEVEQITRRAKRRPISTRLRYEIFLRDGHRCVDCGASAQDDPLVRLEIDHRVPVSKGGTNNPENLQTLCWACNNGKSDQLDHKLTE